MTTNQEGVHAAIRAVTGTSRSYNEDWHALFDDDGTSSGTFNERMLGWINATLSASYTNLNEAMQAFAVEQGFANWASMNTFVAGSEAATFLRTYGPYGMVMNFADDASIKITDEAGLLDFNSRGQVSGGALVGPGAKLTYTAPSLKLTEQADGNLGFQAHNLYLNSAAPANQSVTTGILTGATYAITLTGSVSITLSGAATGTITAGTTTFTAASGTLTCGSTSGSGTVHLRRTPSIDTYVATTGAQVYDLPYVYSSGVRTGILPEPAATNLALRSTNLAATWSFGGASQATSSENSPLGGSAFALVEDSSTGQHRAIQFITATNTTYTASAILKAGTRSWAYLTIVDSTAAARRAWFNLADGTIGTQEAGLTCRTESLNDGWWRVVATVATASTGANMQINATTSDNVANYVGVAGDHAILFAHYQFELGTVATSPIITYGSTVLRAADQPNALLNLFPSIGTAYTIYAKYKPQSASVATTAIRLDDTTANELVSLGNNASGQGLATVTDGGAAQAAITSGTITASAFHRVAASVEANNVRLVVNGGAEVQDTSVTLPTLTRLLFTAGGGMELVQLAILPGARTEAQLQALGA